MFNSINDLIKSVWSFIKSKFGVKRVISGSSKYNAVCNINGRKIFIPGGSDFLWGPDVTKDTPIVKKT